MPQSPQKPRNTKFDDWKFFGSPRVQVEPGAAAPRPAADKNCRWPSGTCGNGRSTRRRARPRRGSAPRRTGSRRNSAARCRGSSCFAFSGARRFQVGSSSCSNSLFWRMILSEKSATFRDHALCRIVADGFDIVAVGVEDERAVIVRMIHWPQPRPAIVAAAGRDRRGVEGVDLGPAARREGDSAGGPSAARPPASRRSAGRARSRRP